MDRPSNTFLEFWHSLTETFTVSNLQLLLLTGTGILAICLLVLALTRWGQSRPVWKCVILSFGAHILLMGYAYGTHMIFDTPTVANHSDPMRVNLVEERGKSVSGSEGIDSSPQPWDEFVNQQAVPDVEMLERPLIDTEVVLERIVAGQKEMPTQELAIEQSAELPPPLMAPPTESSVDTNDFSGIEIAETKLESPEIPVERRGETDSPELEAPTFDLPDHEVARTEIENQFQPITKPDQAVEADPSVINDTPNLVSELVDRDSEFPIADENLPSPAIAPPAMDFKPLRQSRSANRIKLISRPRRLGDGRPLPRMYSLRNAENRDQVAKQRGGSIETEQSVNAALQWLADNQESDGRWDSSKNGAGQETKVFGHDRKGAGADADCGITGLATLSFLASGHTHLEGPFQDQVKSALEYLVQKQKLDGNLAGDAKLFARMYCHSMSLLALSEALALTGDQRLFSAVQRAVDYSVKSQNRRDGGWRYQPGDTGDMSQFGWQVLALHSAKLGGAVVPQSTFDRMDAFIESCSSGVGGGLSSYRPAQGPSTTMTAEALLCRYFVQKNVAETTRMEAVRRIAMERPTPHHVNLYYWYYGTLAMYHSGGPEWERWNDELKSTLLGLQSQTGPDAGSWPANGVWGGYGGRVYSTAMATLNLEVYYRYLPMYDVAKKPASGAPTFR